METETETVTGEWVAIRPHAHLSDRSVIDLARGGRVVNRMAVKPDELQAIVQAAYDQHGILAEPSLEVERRAYEARQAEAEDVELRTFADAWGESLRGQS